MSQEEIVELFENKQFFTVIQPKHSCELIEKLLNENEDTKSRLSKIEDKIQSIEKVCESKIQEKCQLIEKTYNGKLAQIESKIESNEQNYKTMISNVDSKHQLKFSQIDKEQKNQDDQISKLSKNSNEQYAKCLQEIRLLGEKQETKLKERNILKQVNENIEKKIKSDDSSKIVYDIQYSNSPFEGIINELTKKYQGNINNIGVISISGRSIGLGPISSLVDFKYGGDSYSSTNKKNSSICFDFKDHLISVSSYSIKGTNFNNYLKSWNLEGSNDQNSWITLDSHSNDSSLLSFNVIKTFHIQNPNNREKRFRFIRILSTGPDGSGSNNLTITNIEFYGKYYKS